VDEHKYGERKERASQVVEVLNELFPNARIVLHYGSHSQMLVAVVLSAQCTDKKVNEVTDTLFQKYPDLEHYINADSAEFEQDIKPTGFYRNKTKNILAAAKIVKEKYNSTVPNTMKALLELPGVARKTANIVLGNAYGIVEGIAVDTHVRRLSIKLDLTDNTNPDKIEQDLMRIFPEAEWFALNYRLIEYGRQICPARKHSCSDHPLTKIYPPAANIWP